MFIENESVTRTCYEIVQTMAEHDKPFTDGKLIEECMMQPVNDLCPEVIFLEVSVFQQVQLCVENRTRGEYSATDTRES